jgi:hypothetical protein
MIKLKTSKELGEVFRKLLQIAALLHPPRFRSMTLAELILRR